MQRRTPVNKTENEHKDSKPANNEADHGFDSDDDINVILPSIAEQRKFAEGASHIANLQKFQKVLDKLGLGNVMKKYYVLNYRDVWARAAGGQYQGVVGRGNRRWNWRRRGRGWNRGRDRERGTGRGLKIIDETRDNLTYFLDIFVGKYTDEMQCSGNEDNSKQATS